MPLFRKKPVVVEAVQYSTVDALPDNFRNRVFQYNRDMPHCYVTTLSGDARCEVGDWLIRSMRDEVYPCKPDVFDAVYEPAPP